MGLSNLPDGVRESDLPGYWDIECPLCCEGCERLHDDCVCGLDGDPDIGNDYINTCHLCDGTLMCDSREAREYSDDSYADTILDDRDDYRAELNASRWD